MSHYKFLDEAGCGLFTGQQWDLPRSSTPGEWASVVPPLRPCAHGWHVCRVGDLVEWLGPRLWEVEISGETVSTAAGVVAERVRVMRPVEGWSEPCAAEFATACVWRLRDLVVAECRRDGDASVDVASHLADCTTLAALRDALPGTAALEGETTGLLAAWAIDATDLVEADDIAGVAYLVAHAAERATSDERPARDETDFDRERAWQTRWLIDRLGLSAG